MSETPVKTGLFAYSCHKHRFRFGKNKILEKNRTCPDKQINHVSLRIINHK
mgnify:CR=1 FL=1